jgi:hypothetical protein
LNYKLPRQGTTIPDTDNYFDIPICELRWQNGKFVVR